VDILALLEHPKDFLAEKAKPQPGVRPLNYLTSTAGASQYLKRLEDIDSSWVYKYLEMVIVGLKQNAKKGIREAENEVKEYRLYHDNEEDELISEAELALENQITSWEVSIRYQERMIAILKRLHSRSKLMHISYISSIIAYEICKRRYPGKVPSIGLVLECGVYKMNNKGEFGTPVRQNETFREVFGFLSGWYPTDPLYGDMMELISMCEELNIHLEHENACDYGEDFINQLVVTHITENRDYYVTERNTMNRANYNLLQQLEMDSYHEIEQIATSNEKSATDRLTSLILNFNSLTSTKQINVKTNREQEAETFIVMYMRLKGLDYKLEDFVTEDGVYKLRNLGPFLFDVNDITKKPEMTGARAVLHFSGYLILKTSSSELYVLSTEDAMIYMAHVKHNNIQPGQSYSNQKVFGSWVEIAK
jgi:hypothetical protein